MQRFLIFLFTLMSCMAVAVAEESVEASLQQQADIKFKEGNPIGARSLYIRAFKDNVDKNQIDEAVYCGIKAAHIYFKDKQWPEAFKQLNETDYAIRMSKQSKSQKEALLYQTSKERYTIYSSSSQMKNAFKYLESMEQHANASGDSKVKNDFLYNKALYYYTTGNKQQGDACLKQMSASLTGSKDYANVEKVYKTLISNGRKSGSITVVDQSYRNYMAWKDSIQALKMKAATDSLSKRIADNEALIREQEDTLGSRLAMITVYSIITGILVLTLILGLLMMMRVGLVVKKQKKTISEAKENIALKAQFIGNIAQQMAPTLSKLDKNTPEVKNLTDFIDHVQQLSTLEKMEAIEAEREEVQIQSYCEGLVEEIRNKVNSDVVISAVAPKIDEKIYKDYVTHILRHLLYNAAANTPAGGHVKLEFKKRGAHVYQFIVSDTGEGITAEEHENIFKPFVAVRDLSQGDGLGLPICKQMVNLMEGELVIDETYTKGARFILNLHD